MSFAPVYSGVPRDPEVPIELVNSKSLQWETSTS